MMDRTEPSDQGRLRELDKPVGRKEEIAEALDRLQSPESASMRLLTLTGPAGVGKTRVGIQAARQLIGEFVDDVHFIELHEVEKPDQVLTKVAETIARKLGLEETEEQQPLERLQEYLKDEQVLLFLDTFEQVIAASSPQVEELLGACQELLETCPNLKVLVTSQHVIGLAGYEQVYTVPPLELPEPNHLEDLEALEQNPAVALFLQRARQQTPSFSLGNDNAPAIVDICIHLDGIPLAIILAADRIRHFPPPTVLESKLLDEWLLELLSGKARDLPPRHQTLWNSFGRSYELLNEDEQRLFRRLGVFREGFTLEAAKAVCSKVGGLPMSVLNGLTSLADKSLLQWPGLKEEDEICPIRPTLLRTVREYALERLRADDEKAGELLRAHANHYLSLAEKAELKLTSREQSVWLDLLEAEHDNLQTAFRWSIDQGEAETALRLSGALWQFWRKRGRLKEGMDWLELALVESEQVDSAIRAKALAGAGILASYQDEYNIAQARCTESQNLFRGLKDNKRGLAVAVIGMARVARARGNYDGARVMYEEARELYEAVYDEWGVARSLHHLSLTYYQQGEYAKARSRIEESLLKLRTTGDRHAVASAQDTKAMIALAQDEPLTARELLERSLATMRQLGDNRGIARALRNLAGFITSRQDDHLTARDMYKTSLTMYRELNSTAVLTDIDPLVGTRSVRRNLLHPAP